MSPLLLSPMDFLKAIFPFSPGNVPNADCWFGGSDGGNIIKTLDVKMATPITTSRKPRATMVIIFDSANNGDDISQYCHNRAH